MDCQQVGAMEESDVELSLSEKKRRILQAIQKLILYIKDFYGPIYFIMTLKN